VQVVACSGVSGSNAEYVTQLADFVRQHIPRDDDSELFQLDAKVRRLLSTSHSSGSSSSTSSTLTHVTTHVTTSSASSPAFSSQRDVIDRDMSTAWARGSNVAVTVVAG